MIRKQDSAENFEYAKCSMIDGNLMVMSRGIALVSRVPSLRGFKCTSVSPFGSTSVGTRGRLKFGRLVRWIRPELPGAGVVLSLVFHGGVSGYEL